MRNGNFLAAAGVAAAVVTGLSGPGTAQPVADPHAAIKAAAMDGLHPALEALYNGIDGGGPAMEVAPLDADGYVRLDAVAALDDVESLAAELDSLGARHVSVYGRVVSAALPADALDELSQSRFLRLARHALAAAGAGIVTSEGDITMRSDAARSEFGVDGEGTRVGLLSDSFNCLTDPTQVATTQADDIASDDLPADIIILDDLDSGCSDEGRAMGQIVHDVAPGAALAFHTAFNGMADFANGILELGYEAGSDVIVDDVIFFAEPMFLDGVIAQAADTVNGWNIPYFSSAGNNVRDSYEDAFRAVEADPGGIAGLWHDFDPGEGVDPLQDFQITPAGGLAQTTLSFQWDEPFFSVSGAPGSASDVDAVFFGPDGELLLDCFADNDPAVFPDTGGFPPICQFGSVDNSGGDAVELPSVVSFVGPVTVQLGFRVASGPAPGRVKYVPFGRSGGFAIAEFATDSGTAFGHANAAGAEAVGAAFWLYTEEFEAPNTVFDGGDCIPACLNNFSSAGGIPILFDADGNRLASPEIRIKPGVTAPDGGNNTFFGGDTGLDSDSFPNFFGTSAAAPHAAAIAALMFDAEDAGLSDERGGGQPNFRLCVPRGKSGRETSITVAQPAVLGFLERGGRFRDCAAIGADAIHDIQRATAQDMTERWTGLFGLPDGGILVAIEEVAEAEGFDFDTGFGMIDAVEALRALEDGEVLASDVETPGRPAQSDE